MVVRGKGSAESSPRLADWHQFFVGVQCWLHMLLLCILVARQLSSICGWGFTESFAWQWSVMPSSVVILLGDQASSRFGSAFPCLRTRTSQGSSRVIGRCVMVVDSKVELWVDGWSTTVIFAWVWSLLATRMTLGDVPLLEALLDPPPSPNHHHHHHRKTHEPY